MTKWLLRCTRCGRTWVLEVSFDLTKLSNGRLYHYCPYCKQNTFHEVMKRVEEDEEVRTAELMEEKG
ncbi:hypothetical protein [Hyperthermus butylicus]|uniref:hypothetical protein n=1 Tax=Hyperthermus butylicus TaxID=54248 RepID=UPI00032174FA|nr:hypothetical protein [Hyperthermus butylicus]